MEIFKRTIENATVTVTDINGNVTVEVTNASKYKAGDILITKGGNIFIFKEEKYNSAFYYAYLCPEYKRLWIDNAACHMNSIGHYANDDEKVKLFKALEEEGKWWNPTKLEIEDIPEFKRGDILVLNKNKNQIVVFDKHTYTASFDSIYNNIGLSNHGWGTEVFRHATEEEKRKFFNELREKGKRWNTEKLCVENIPEPLKVKDKVIAWCPGDLNYAVIGILQGIEKDDLPYVVGDESYSKAIKWDGTETQYEKVLKGEI